MTAKELYQAGKLAEAVVAQTDAVKKKPSDVCVRGFLVELLCFAGDFERADKQLDAMATLDAKTTHNVMLWRHLVRAEQARRQFYQEGRLPEFLDKPAEHVRLQLEASIHIREGRLAPARELLEQAEAMRPKCKGKCGSDAFDDFRDLDDLSGPVLEALTNNGKFYWIGFEQIETLEFPAATCPRDLLWRPMQLAVRGGPDGLLYMPSVYPLTKPDAEARLLLGRATDWQSGDGEPVRGLGLREFLVGSACRNALELTEIVFEPTGTG